MKRIVLYDLDRVLLIFLLLSNLKKDEIIYISFFNKKEKIEKLPGKKIFINEEKIETFFLKRKKYIKEIRKKLMPLIEQINNKKIYLYGLDHYALAMKIFYKEEMYVIEEGTFNYSFISESIGQKIKKIIKSFFIRERKKNLGYGDKVKKIYFTENLCKEIPKGLEKKAEIINLKELWNKKSEEEKKIILNTFNFNEEILKKADKNTIMLFTQPLSEDNVITEEEKIDLYSKILKKYDNQSIIIKPHPREKTDYSKYFPSYYVMKERYPVEILELVGINIKKAITIFSSAAFGLGKNVEIDFYGTEIYYKLFERFGTQDKVMKRNAFLD